MTDPNAIMSDTRTCPECNAPLPLDAPDGVCPHCTLRAALGFADGEHPTGSAETVVLAKPLEEDDGGLPRFGDYQLLEEIARGGMGVVYKARQVSLDRIVAVKMLLFGPMASKDYVQRFRVEASAAASLQHPNIVAVHEVGVHQNQHYLVMDYIAGQTLSKLSGGQPLPPRVAARYVKTIAEAIHFAHERGVLHRDLKPSNVLIDLNDEPHVTDFGLAKRLDADSDLTLSGQILGSPNYMSPEQAMAKRGKVGRHSDVYSLGAILFHLLTGRPPFVAESPSETIQLVLEREPITPRVLVAHVPADLETICLKCLEKEAAKRYATAKELTEELGRFLNDEPIHGRRVSRVEKVWRWCRRNPRVASLSAATVLLLLAVAIGSPIAAYRINRERQRAVDAVRDLRRNLYVSDMALAWQALQDKQVGRVRNLLEAYLPGKPGEEDLRGFEWRLIWQRSLTNYTDSLTGHQGQVMCVAFSPDRASLATAGMDRTVIVWDLAAKRLMRKLEGFDAFIDAKALAFSPDGRMLAAKGGRQLRVWRTDTWQEATTLQEVEPNEVFNNAVVFSPDGSTLATRAFDSEGMAGVAFWTTKNWQRTEPFLPNAKRASTQQPPRYSTIGTVMTYSNDGQLLAVSDKHELQIRDARRPANIVTNLVRWPVDSDMRVLAVAISADYVAAGYRDGVLVLWQRGSWEQVAWVNANQSVLTDLAFSPDGLRLAAAGGGHVIPVWEVKILLGHSGRTDAIRAMNTLRGHTHEPLAVAFAPDGRTLASGSRDETVKLWNISQRAERPNLAGSVRTVGFSADGKVLAALHDDGRVHVWDVGTRQDWGPVGPPVGEHTSAALAPSGRLLAVVSTNGNIQLWQVSPPLPLDELAGNGNSISALQFSPEPQTEHLLVLSVKGDRFNYRLHNPAQHTSRSVLSGIMEPGNWALDRSFAFSPDGTRLAILDRERGLTVFNVSGSEENPRRIGADSTKFICVTFSPDGSLLATGEWQQPFVWLWDAKTGWRQPTLAMGHGSSHSLAFSPEGDTLLTSDLSNITRFWNVPLRKEILTVANLNPMICGAWFSPPGNALALLTSREYQRYGGVELFTVPSLAEIDATVRPRAASNSQFSNAEDK